MLLAWILLILFRALQMIFTFIKTQEGMGKIKQLFKQADIYFRLERCKDVLESSLRAFRVSTFICLATPPDSA